MVEILTADNLKYNCKTGLVEKSKLKMFELIGIFVKLGGGVGDVLV